jgi:XRE family transcriptional regulator of biofilm formation
MRMSIGEKVKRLRFERGLTQAELADRANISQAVISRLEADVRRNVNADVLKALARALGCTTDYLVGMHEEDESEGIPTDRTLVGS